MANFKTEGSSTDWRTYYLRVPVRSYFWEAVRGESTNGREPQPTPPVAAEIGIIAGIQSFYVHEGYELIVHKASAYSWEEIETDLHAAIDGHNTTAEWPAFENPITQEPEVAEAYDTDGNLV